MGGAGEHWPEGAGAGFFRAEEEVFGMDGPLRQRAGWMQWRRSGDALPDHMRARMMHMKCLLKCQIGKEEEEEE